MTGTNPVSDHGADRRRSARALPRRRRRVASLVTLSRRARTLIGTGAVVAALGLWQLAASEHWVNALITSSPGLVVQSGLDMARTGTLGKAVAETTRLFVVGFGLSLLTGLPGGVLLGWYRRLDAALDPFVSMLYVAPRLAIIPLIMLWAGIGFTAQVVIVWLTAVFPIIINVSAGVRSIDRDLLQVARSFRATNRDVLLTLAIPGSIPSVISGIRQGLGQGLIGVVVAEYFVGNNGVGGLIFNAGMTLESGKAFAGVAIFAGAALLLTGVLRAVERRVDRWRM